MNFYLPTYDECLNLVKMENSPFYESINYIDGYKVSVFNYRLATTADFIKNIIEIESDEGIILKINGDVSINGKLIRNMSDEELISIGFDSLSKFKII